MRTVKIWKCIEFLIWISDQDQDHDDHDHDHADDDDEVEKVCMCNYSPCGDDSAFNDQV